MKRKKQPTAAMMREQLALAADEIIWLRELLYDGAPFAKQYVLGFFSGVALSAFGAWVWWLT